MKFSELLSALSTRYGYSSPAHVGIDPEITSLAPVEEATTGMLSYIEGEKFAAQVDTTAASGLILPLDEALQNKATDRGIAWLAVPVPRLAFAQTIALFYQPYCLPTGIHSTAVIDPSVVMGSDVAIGAHVVIQAGARIGNQVCIHPNVVIYPSVEIGDRTVLHANCVIHERSQIGADCVIHSGAAIGSEGFGFVPVPEGWFKMHQSGYTILEDGVEIGCNSTVDRPAVGTTCIGRHTKIDNLVHIAHNCHIGENCAMAAQVGMAGGVHMGHRVILGGQVGIANQVKIGNGVQAAAKAGIHNDVAEGQVVIGIPAIAYRTFLRATAVFPRLPEMQKAIRELQKQIGGKPSST
jgi:UDP-3-O-[3-hydroxymyristoyl] glucosamine N-acyltransferase